MAFNAIGLPLEYCSQEFRAQQAHRNGRRNATTAFPSQRLPPRSLTQPLWTPSDPSSTAISQYRQRINDSFKPVSTLQTSQDLHNWSIEHPHDFWIDLYDYCGIIPPLSRSTKCAYDPKARLRDIPIFFPGLRLNYAENVLVPNASRQPNAVALVGVREGHLDHPENITWVEVSELVRMTRSAMLRRGINQGDIIAALMANSIWIIVLFLSAASIGAIFTSVAPDLGVQGCVSRFAQVQPKWLFADTDCALRGVRVSMLGKVLQVVKTLPMGKGQGRPRIVFVPTCHRPHLKENLEYIRPVGDAISLKDFLEVSREADQMAYTRVPTDHPLVIVYSSGTTGEPKCIVSPHISILNYKKIAFLHNNLSSASTVFQYSSTSWILWVSSPQGRVSDSKNTSPEVSFFNPIPC
jgi:acetoacetyl-CoA synthetase